MFPYGSILSRHDELPLVLLRNKSGSWPGDVVDKSKCKLVHIEVTDLLLSPRSPGLSVERIKHEHPACVSQQQSILNDFLISQPGPVRFTVSTNTPK